MSRAKHLLILLLVSVAAFIVHNRTILPDIMECRNLVTAREIVESGDWFVPTLNGELRLEKPPLPTWIAAGVEMLSPDNLALQRAAAGVAAMMLVLFFYLCGDLLTRDRRQAFFSSLVLCTSYSLILMGRTATWDIYCHAFMMGAIWLLLRGLLREGRNWGSFLAAGLFMGLSFLSKGPVAFFALLLPFMLTAGLFRVGSLRGKGWPAAAMVLVCLATGGFWHAGLYLFYPEQLDAVVRKESGAWVSYNTRPWWYYWGFFWETGVWALTLLSALVVGYWRRRSTESRREYLFPLVWMVLMLVLLSCVPEKKPRYLLPILVPAAYTVGYLFNCWQRMRDDGWFSRTDKWFFRVDTLLIAAVATVLPVGLYLFLFRPGLIELWPMAGLSALLIAVAAWLWFCSLRYAPKQFLYGVVALFLVAETVLMPYVGAIANNRERQSIRAVRTMPLLQGIPFRYDAADDAPRPEILYEAGRTIRPLSLTDSAAVAGALPFVLLLHEADAPRVPFAGVKAAFVGRFDDNQRQKSAKRYNERFIYNLYLLQKDE
ncbi:MAG: glycosyltransferase family 39 protein [Alistipes sp.]|nr:glycosyltransferase family 39 protein [Alistipes sp.]